MDGWKTSVVSFWDFGILFIFRGDVLVLGKVNKNGDDKKIGPGEVHFIKELVVGDSYKY